MNAGSFAELLDARRCGPGRWMARCPPHQDRTPSLQIAQGDKDVLLHCWTGCSIEEVCTALGLRLHDLFDDRDLSPAERRGASQERQERDVETSGRPPFWMPTQSRSLSDGMFARCHGREVGTIAR